MKPKFWHERWEKDEIGFHQHDFNRHMQEFIDCLGVQAGDNVLVPLCGKSLDMLWLADHGYRVTGIEISELAVRDFFADNGLPFSVMPAEVEQLFGSQYCINRLHSEDCLAIEPRFQKKGLTRFDEHVFILKKNDKHLL